MKIDSKGREHKTKVYFVEKTNRDTETYYPKHGYWITWTFISQCKHQQQSWQVVNMYLL